MLVDDVEIDQNTYFLNSRYGPDTFHGILIDTGAAGQSTAGISQYKAFESLFGPHKLDKSGIINVKFGIGDAPSIGSISVLTPIGPCTFHVIKTNTPFLLSLSDLDNNKAYFDNLSDMIRLLKNDTYISIPVVRKFGHAFLQWGPMTATTSFLTESELRVLHRRFGHPSVQRLVNMLNRAGHADGNHTQILNKITQNCQKCQRYGSAPLRFKFTLRDSDNVDFNQSIFADILYIDGAPVLHVVDEATRFQAARFLQDMTASALWEALRLCWIDTYLGPPAIINHDAGTNFASTDFQRYNKSLGIETKEVPVEAAQSMGIVERYHKPLRRAYEVIREDLSLNQHITSQQTRSLILQMAIKAINDTAGPDGIVPTLLVFGAFPRIVKGDAPTPDIMQRAKAINRAMAEVSKLRARRQIQEAISTRNGPSSKPIPLGSDVLVWRAHRKKWEGPFKLISTINETMTIQLPSGPTQFRSTCIKAYSPNEDSLSEKENEEKQDDPQPEPDSIISPASIPINPALLPRPQRQRRLPARFRDYAANLSFVMINTTLPTDFNASRLKELDGLLSRGVFEFTNLNDIPTGLRIFKSRFIDTIKLQGTAQAFKKSRLVVQAYNDQEKYSVLTQSPTIQRASQRLLFCVALMRNHSIYCRDISQAYTQSKTILPREFFVKPPAELNLSKNVILKVLRPLYGIPEAGNHWFKTYHDHHKSELGLKQSSSDACLLYNESAIVALQTDDTLFACNDEFKQKEQKAIKIAKFQAKDVEKLMPGCSMTFNGAKITLSSDSSTLNITQEYQCENLSIANNRDEYIAQRARGAYIATVCQPQATFDLSQASQTTLPTTDQIKKLNKRLMWQKAHGQKFGLKFTKLDQSKLRLIAFSDASFANNADFSSQIGYVIILADDQHCNLLQWSSTKCKRVTRSVLASELYAMINAFDAACVLKYTIDLITKQSVPLILCTDSLSLFECLVKLGTTKEKRLMIDVSSIREAYELREIAEIVWIKGPSNPADSMTKSNSNRALDDIIASNRYILDKEAWVERDDNSTLKN